MAVSIKDIEKSLRAAAGVVSLAANELGVTRQALYQRIHRSARLQSAVADIEERRKDLVEARLIEALNKGDLPTLRWWAERKLRDRGFSTRTEVTGAGGGPIDINSDLEALTDEELELLELIRARVEDDAGDAQGHRPQGRAPARAGKARQKVRNRGE